MYDTRCLNSTRCRNSVCDPDSCQSFREPSCSSLSICSVCSDKRWQRGDVMDGYMIVPCFACNILGDVRPDMRDWPNMTPCDFKTHNT